MHNNAFSCKAVNKSMTCLSHTYIYSDQKESSVIVDWKKKQVRFKQDLDYDSDWAHLTPFRIEFQTEEEAKENEISPRVAFLHGGLLRRGRVCELERVCDDFFFSIPVTYDGAALLWLW